MQRRCHVCISAIRADFRNYSIDFTVISVAREAFWLCGLRRAATPASLWSMKKTILLGLALVLPLAACEKKSQTAQPSAAAPPATATAGTVGDDAAVAKIAAGTAAKCPVTGEDFTVKENTVQVTYNGKRYAFCCADCQPTFAKNPAKYATK